MKIIARHATGDEISMRLPVSMRRRIAMVAMAALSFVLLQPACDVLALQLNESHTSLVRLLHHDSGAGAGRGDALQPGTHAPSLAAVASAAKDLPRAAVPTALGLAVPAFFPRVAVPGAAPPPFRSYYARSARLLR